jgi:hypothetical protein
MNKASQLARDPANIRWKKTSMAARKKWSCDIFKSAILLNPAAIILSHNPLVRGMIEIAESFWPYQKTL